MHRTQIYLPLTQLKLLQKTAQTEGISVSEIIRAAIQKYFVKTQPVKKNLGVDFIAMAKEVNAVPGEKAPKDLASRMDHYLYGSI